MKFIIIIIGLLFHYRSQKDWITQWYKIQLLKL